MENIVSEAYGDVVRKDLEVEIGTGMAAVIQDENK